MILAVNFHFTFSNQFTFCTLHCVSIFHQVMLCMDFSFYIKFYVFILLLLELDIDFTFCTLHRAISLDFGPLYWNFILYFELCIKLSMHISILYMYLLASTLTLSV